MPLGSQMTPSVCIATIWCITQRVINYDPRGEFDGNVFIMQGTGHFKLLV